MLLQKNEARLPECLVGQNGSRGHASVNPSSIFSTWTLFFRALLDSQQDRAEGREISLVPSALTQGQASLSSAALPDWGPFRSVSLWGHVITTQSPGFTSGLTLHGARSWVRTNVH